ncbi:MAG TPA: glycosyltransferase, partial [Planctomycetota bacterium]|nr:glycosyltransferase [Planctomycetota bacterium]
SDVAAAAARVGLVDGARWFVYVGGFNPHKHVDLVVRAHAALAAKSAKPPHLLLVGATDGEVFHGDHARIRAAIAAAGTEGLVHWTGFVADEELRHLHSGALALLLPSEAEGFGLPAIEAAACGAPVIATRASPLPELLEGGGIFVAPGDLAALEEAMTTLAHDEAARTRMGARALERARLLTWPAGARSALAALEEAAA